MRKIYTPTLIPKYKNNISSHKNIEIIMCKNHYSEEEFVPGVYKYMRFYIYYKNIEIMRILIYKNRCVSVPLHLAHQLITKEYKNHNYKLTLLNGIYPEHYVNQWNKVVFRQSLFDDMEKIPLIERAIVAKTIEKYNINKTIVKIIKQININEKAIIKMEI